MEKYVSPKMNIFEFEVENIVTESNAIIPKGDPNTDPTPAPGEGGFIWAE